MPSLPLELERLIFELAAFQDTDRNNRVRIILVAKRVYEWIRPILYRVVVARAETQTSTLTIQNWKNTKAAKVSDVGHFVRHLLTLTDTESHVLDLLSTCPNIESLAIWYRVPMTPEVFERIKDLPLRMLSADLTPVELDEAITNYSVLKNITHLELLGLKGSTWRDCKALVGLPRLTHLCLDITVNVEEGAVLDLLKHCPSLRALIYLLDTGPPIQKHTFESDDPRFLVFYSTSVEDCVEEWECTANGQIGFWDLADIIIRARNDKRFKDNSSFTFSRETWMDGLNDDGMRWYKEWSNGRTPSDK